MNLSPILELITCPLSGKIFYNPVIADDNEIYEANELIKWFEKNGYISPKNNLKISKSMVIIHPLKAFITELVEKNVDLNKHVYPDHSVPDLYCFNKSKILGHISSEEWDKLFSYNEFMLGDIEYHIFQNMVVNNDCKLLIHIIKHSGDRDNEIGEHHWKLINYVAKWGKPEVLKLLIELGMDVNNPCPGDRWTPLHQAAHSSLNKNVKLLVDAGADINLENSSGSTAFYFIIQHCDYDTIKYCLEKIDRLDKKELCESKIRSRLFSESIIIEILGLISTK